MERKPIDKGAALLKKLLHISRSQSSLLAKNRFADLAKTMAEREEIISEIKIAGRPHGAVARAVIKEILDHDADLRVSIEVELEETRSELQRISHCNTANMAYLSGRAGTPGERFSRDG